MKKLVLVAAIVAAIMGVIVVGDNKSDESESVYRFHIRANSNSAKDQYVKYFVKDKIMELLSPVLSTVTSPDDAIKFIKQSRHLIEEYANHLLGSLGVSYDARVKVGEFYFDEKEIDGVVFSSGNYESMIVELGEADGNNWWGLIYPNLSFIPESVNDEGELVYKSKIAEIYNSLTKV